jgi:hypothetical protein
MRLYELIENYTKDTIIVNGIERSALNSDGNYIATSRSALLNFYKWFGNSVVTDNSGRPLVVYHGTKHHKQPKVMEPSYKRGPLTQAFNSKKYINRLGYSKDQAGMYFTPSRQYADSFGASAAYYLRIEHPLPKKGGYLTLFTAGDVDVIKNELHKDGYIDSYGAGEYVVFDSDQIKRVDNIGSFSTKSKMVNK